MNKNKKVIIPRPVCRRCHCQPVARGLEICNSCGSAAIRLVNARIATRLSLAERATWELHDGDQVRGTLKGYVCADCVSAYGGKECRCGHPVWVADFAAKAVA